MLPPSFSGFSPWLADSKTHGRRVWQRKCSPHGTQETGKSQRQGNTFQVLHLVTGVSLLGLHETVGIHSVLSHNLDSQ